MTRYALLSLLVAFGAAHADAADSSKGYWEYRFTDPATNLAFLSLIIFLAIVWRVGGFRIITGFLDKRASTIKDNLEEARKLREEAQRRLAEMEQRQRDAEAEAEAIVARARSDAEAMMEQARRDLNERLARREAQANARIARAEEEATREVRRAAADAATTAARNILAASPGADPFDRALAEIEAALPRN
jgi:F-type H+-transporting ATPase subunit b